VSVTTLQRAVQRFEARLPLLEQRRHKIVWRIDGGFGSDANINWLVQRGYQVLAKGISNRRAGALAKQVKRWRLVTPDKWVGMVLTPEPFARPVHTFVLRWRRKEEMHVAYLYTTLPGSGRHITRFYDQRGGAETEFRSDKSGGAHLDKRRKHKRDAQEVWLHLTDMAHNYWSWFQRQILTNSPLATFGHLRISRDLMHIPGTIEMHNGQLLSVKFAKAVPHAATLLDCLQRFWE
jgi:hypothetical protein